MAIEGQDDLYQEKNPVYDEKHAGNHADESGSGSGIGEIVPVETTKRGLKARHAQMIALGGTIGKLFLNHCGKLANSHQELVFLSEVVQL